MNITFHQHLRQHSLSEHSPLKQTSSRHGPAPSGQYSIFRRGHGAAPGQSHWAPVTRGAHSLLKEKLPAISDQKKCCIATRLTSLSPHGCERGGSPMNCLQLPTTRDLILTGQTYSGIHVKSRIYMKGYVFQDTGTQ